MIEDNKPVDIGDLLDEIMTNPNLEFPVHKPPSIMREARPLGKSPTLEHVGGFGELGQFIDELSRSSVIDVYPAKYDLMNFAPEAAYIMPIEDLTEILIRGVRAYFGGLYSQATFFNREAAAKAIHGLFEDYLFRQLYWHAEYRDGGSRLLRPAERYDKVMSSFIPPKYWHLPEHQMLVFTQAIEKYELEVSDRVRTTVFDRMKKIVPEPTYDIFRTTLLPGGVLLQKGPDFRIVDWTRRMESGEWR